MGNVPSCGKIDKPHIPNIPIKKNEIIQTQSKTQSKALPRSFDREANNIVPTDMTYCRNGNGVYELKTNNQITSYAIKYIDRWLYIFNKPTGNEHFGGEQYLLFSPETPPQLMIEQSKEDNYHYIKVDTQKEKEFIKNIRVINGYTNENTNPIQQNEGMQLNNYVNNGATIYFHNTLCNAMSYTPSNNDNVVKFNDKWDALKVTINGMEMYAYAMPPIISGGYKKKKTSTKTKTQAKHTFMHGKKTYTRVIHLGKRGGKYVMLNGELVPIYKLQTSSQNLIYFT